MFLSMQYTFKYIQLDGQKLVRRKASFNNQFLTSYGLPLFFTLIGIQSYNFVSLQYETVIYLHFLVQNNCGSSTSFVLTFHKIRVYTSVFHAAVTLSTVNQTKISAICTFS
jgi:hypothetical protein